MVYMDIYFFNLVNGVVVLYIEILKNLELKLFYVIYFEKFNNKINGIMFCCWLEFLN